MNYQERYNQWLNSSYIDTEMKAQLKKMQDDPDVIKECFYGDLEFGTGGLRGEIGPGTNRMNKYTVRKATQGLANYIIKAGQQAMERGVAIAYDSRHCSPEFAEEAALVLNANGIHTHIFRQLTPTPMLSFAVRELQTIAGIVITASHNPPKDNGYKVYWEDGGQIIPAVADQVIAEIQQVTDFSQIKYICRAEAESAGLFHVVDDSVDEKFYQTLVGYSFIDDSFRQQVADLKIIFTPLHGTGNIPVREVLARLGFANVAVVPEQELPDANFPTVKKPNPEEAEAFALAIKMAETNGADLIIGTDPDCDRIGVAEKVNGKYDVLKGNQVGVLLSEYILTRLKEKNQLSANGVIVKTIVTTEMVRGVAGKYGVQVLDTLTGFKFIGEKIKEFETSGQYTYILGFEESYGYLVGTHARDKDAVVAAAMICEMAAYYRKRGLSLHDQLARLMNEYGFFMEDQHSVTLPGIAGMEKIRQIMDTLRTNVPTKVGRRNVVIFEDYQTRRAQHLQTGKQTTLDLPESDVLKFRFDDQSDFTIRPSGTEPKVKIYFSVTGKSFTDAREALAVLKTDILGLLGLE